MDHPALPETREPVLDFSPERPPLRPPALLGVPLEDDVPRQEGADPPPEALTPEKRYGAPPDHVRQMWEKLTQEKGRTPTRREMKEAVGGNNAARNAWCQALEKEARLSLPEPGAVAQCRDALAVATRDLDACQALQGAEQTRLAQMDQELADLRLHAARGDTTASAAIPALDQAQWTLHRALTVQLPAKAQELTQAVDAATQALEAAILEAQRVRYNTLGEERRALIGGGLEEKKDAFVEELHTYLANLHEQQDLALELGLPPGNSREQLSFWLYSALADVVEYPPRDRFMYSPFPHVDALVDADTSLQPVSKEELPQVSRQARRWVRYVGQERPNFTWPGLEQLRQNLLNERNFQQGKPLEVSASEEETLRSHYGDAIRRVVPPLWR